MDPHNFPYLRRASSFASLEALRSVVGILLGLFLVLWIRNPTELDDDQSEESKKAQSLLAVLAALIAFYFIFDFYLSRSMSLNKSENVSVPKYPIHLRICLIIQFLLLVCVSLVGGNLIWNSQSPATREPMIKKMVVVFLSLYLYELCSVFYAYYAMLSSYEYIRSKIEAEPAGDKDALNETRSKLQEI